MLFVSGFGADTMSELTALKKRVDQCVRSFPITGSNDAAAGQAATCDMFVGGTSSQEGIRAFEKLSFLERADNAIMFDIARTLLTNWRNTGMDAEVSSTEVNVRRIAAQKLGEDPVLEGGPVQQAVQTLSSTARIESSDIVKLAMIASLARLLRTRADFIEPPVRTEALTTLKVLADPNNTVNSVEILNAANDALKSLAPRLEIGPVTITSVPKPPRSKFFVPLVAMGITAVAATGALVLFFRHQDARGLSAAGPLRRKAEAALRRRRVR